MKLSENDLEKIFELHLSNERSEEIAKIFNVTTATINRVIIKCNSKNNITDRHRPPNKSKENLVGQTFGYLDVIKQLPPLEKRKKWKYICKCKLCGNEIIADSYGLKNRKNETCGCKTTVQKKGKYSPNFNGFEDISGSFWAIVKKNARLRNIKVNITVEDGWNLYIKQNKKCALSGVDISFGYLRHDETTASLDRIDSKKDYTIDNIQWVHKSVNFMKHDLSEEKFLFYCNKIIENDFNKRKIQN